MHALFVAVTFLVYDASTTPRQELAQARLSVEAALGEAAVDATWRECTNSEPSDSCNPHDRAAFVIRLIQGTAMTPPDVLGSSLVDGRLHGGTLATVYVDRVHAMAARAGVDAGILLGRVVAHELGHLLLGTNEHSARGLMRADWCDDELRRNQREDWIFSPEEAARIRKAVRSRT